jgi:hypothetical protein
VSLWGGGRVLVGLGQTVDVAKDARALFAILEVELAAAAELAHEEQDAIPEQEALVVLDAILTARVWDLVEPAVEAGEEVPDGAREGGAGVQGRPAFLRLWVVWVLIRATVS